MQITKVDNKAFQPENVELREALVSDMINAERIVGKSQGIEFLNAVVSQVAVFDGVKQPPEEVQRLSSKDFLIIADAAGLSDVPISPPESSTSSEKDDGEKKE